MASPGNTTSFLKGANTNGHCDQGLVKRWCGRKSPTRKRSICLKELHWWSSPDIHAFKGHPLQTPPFDMMISTDASLIGWGATWPGTTIGCQWLPQEAQSHINLLELKAAYLALQAFFKSQHPTPKHVLIQMDNTMAVAYVNKRGGT